MALRTARAICRTSSNKASSSCCSPGMAHLSCDSTMGPHLPSGSLDGAAARCSGNAFRRGAPNPAECLCRVHRQHLAFLSTHAIPNRPKQVISAVNVPVRPTKDIKKQQRSSPSSPISSSGWQRPPQRFQSAVAAVPAIPSPAPRAAPTALKPSSAAPAAKPSLFARSAPSPAPSAPPPPPPVVVDVAFLRQVDINPNDLLALAGQKPTPLRLADMYKYGNSEDAPQRLRNAQFLHREMPIRIAQRVVDLLTLPFGLSEARPIRQVAEIYCRYLQRFQAMPCPRTAAEEDAFTDMLQAFVLDRSSIPLSIARGVSAWRSHQRLSNEGLGDDASASLSAEEEASRREGRLSVMDDALYRFFMARVGLRFLTEHHVLSSRRPECQELRKVTHLFPDNSGGSVAGSSQLTELGCIQSDCDLVRETRRVADLVMKQTTEYYGMCPRIEIVDCQQNNNDDGPGSAASTAAHDPFTYVTHHLHYMMAELLKNSCRATVQQYLHATREGGGLTSHLHSTASGDLPKLHPIRVIITKGEEDVTIKVADRGGGIPRSWMGHVWKFGHSQHGDPDEFQAEFGTSEGAGARIRGFGLPLARIYARYFGGELNLKSMEGYGVDAYLHLPRLGASCENLPMRVRASPGERDSTPGRSYQGKVRG